MEKYSQFRDKGTAIAPFLPVPPAPASFLWTPVSVSLFLLRLPFLLGISVLYFCFLEYMPIGHTIRYCALWLMLGIPGVWWVDLQVDGVRRGQLHTSSSHLPRPGSIIASSFTSPLDPLYLAAIFQPIFTRSYPHTRTVERITLFSAIKLAFSAPALHPPADSTRLVTLKQLTEQFPHKIICVFPESTTTNGRGILPLCPSLLSATPTTRIYPVNLRYTPQDITTPVPGSYAAWLWKLLNKPTHQMRVRIAAPVYNSRLIDRPGNQKQGKGIASGYDSNIFDQPSFRDDGGEEEQGEIGQQEQKVLVCVAEDLARLGRVKRVGLGVEEKAEFVKVWGSRKR
ncbi:Lysophosphatidic acid:oleoyl-CoA acyltransferase 1 [Pleosporales sp. CAS-2024a]